MKNSYLTMRLFKTKINFKIISLIVFGLFLQINSYSQDTDGDGVLDAIDLDDDNDGIADIAEGVIDTDNDFIINSLDLDSDNDGISDIVESGLSLLDLNNDGRIDALIDLDNNGLHDPLDNLDLFPQDNAASTFSEVNGIGSFLSKDCTLSVESISPTFGSFSIRVDNSTGNSNGGAFVNIGMRDARAYRVSYRITLVSGGGSGIVRLFSSSATGNSQSLIYSGGSINVGQTLDVSTIITPASGDVSLQFSVGLPNAVYLIDKVSIREVELFPQDNAASTFSEFNSLGSLLDKDCTLSVESVSPIFGSHSVRVDNSTGNSNGGPFAVLGLDDTKTYHVNYRVTLVSGAGTGTVRLFSSSATGSSQSLIYTGSSINVGQTLDISTIIAPASGDVSLQFSIGLSNAVYLIDKVSVREVFQILPDTDADSFSDYIDLDSDGDGLPDNIEAQITLGYITPNAIFDGNGFDTAYVGGLTPVDTDTDGQPDYLDLDSDDEGANDTTEAGLTLSGVVGNNGLIASSETIDDYTDVNGVFNNPVANFPDADNDVAYGGDVDFRDRILNPDTDGDTVPDIGDIDDDNDGITDVDESSGNIPNGDEDGDGVENWQDVIDNGGVGDGSVTDYIDVDANGIPDVYDIDGDGIPNHLDIDADADGVNDIHEAGHSQLDTDNDGRIDLALAGSGFNGLFDAIESDDTISASITYTLTNTDGDSLIDILDIDDDGDGVHTIHEGVNPDGDGDPSTGATQNTDAASGDTVPDYLDVDDDGDGVHTIHEGVNPDGDGDPSTGATQNTDAASGDTVPDYLDIDDDGDGVHTIHEGVNPDGDGDPSTGATQNTDAASGNTVPDYLDIDDDGDGVHTIHEGVNPDGDGDPSTGATQNTDAASGDTVPDYLDVDDDGDGVHTIHEGVNPDGDGNPSTGATQNTDAVSGDTVPDYLDVDDDGDGVHTIHEGVNPDGDGNPSTGATQNTDAASGNTVPDYLDNDDDGDGYPTASEDPDPNGDGNPVPDARDTDSNGIPDYLSADDDGDGIPTADEDTNGDGDPTNDDEDGDGIPNYIDLDSDNDGIPDAIETGTDTDGDGIPNFRDLDSDNDGIYDVMESGQLNGTTIVDNSGGFSDGVIDAATPVSVGANGLLDLLETAIDSGVLITPTADSDSDSIPDSMELDADADGCNDVLEAGFTDPESSGDPGFGLLGSGGIGTGLLVDASGVVISGVDGYTTPADVNGNAVLDFQEANVTTAINTQPVAPTAILAGANVSISVVSTGNTYQWQESTDGITWTNITNGGTAPEFIGATTNSLTVNNVPATYGGRRFRVVVSTNNYICDTALESNAVAITILGDNDSDGIPDITDLDDDNDGIPDALEGGDALDTDGDGIPNRFDLDSDNDGIYDVVEAGLGSFDSNNNGVINTLISVGTNGLFDALETSPDSGTLAPANQPLDSTHDASGNPAPDGVFDFLELDSDGDGCFDVIEAGFTDGDGDNILGTSPVAVDINTGLVTSAVDGYTTPANVNGGNFDFQEYNQPAAVTTEPSTPAPVVITNNVTITGAVANSSILRWQQSSDGTAGSFTDILDTDAGFTGQNTNELTINNVSATTNRFYRLRVEVNNYRCNTTPAFSTTIEITIQGDADGDGIPDVIDLDDDNDGIPDVDEELNVPVDIDGDGIPNRLDLDSDNDGIYDIVESGQIANGHILDNVVDGRIDGADASNVGANGLYDALETAPDSGVLIDATADSTSDPVTGVSAPNGIIDSNELDSDNDGCFDITEAGFGSEDLDGDNMLGSAATLVVNSTGLVDLAASGLTLGYTAPTDFGNDGTFDFQVFGIGVTPITSQPSDQTVVINAPAVFNVNGQPVTFQWYQRVNPTAPWTVITDAAPVLNTFAGYSGATTNELTLTMIPGSYNGYQYRVVLSSPAFACDVNQNSDPATLTVYPDYDGDGVGDPVDVDSDNDGIPNTDEYNGLNPYADVDGDGVPAYLDDNDINISVGDNDGAVQSAYDTDGDGIANHLDIDSDGDGIYDVNEAGHGNLDTDGDGFIDGATTGSGANGLFDGVETTPESGTINYTLTDSDSNGTPNFLDTDDDGDGVPTASENPDLNGDGNPDDAQDTDNDGVDDYLDIDDDNDGILTIVEGTANPDGDSRANYLDLDSDGDGLADNVEAQTTNGYIVPSGTVNAQGLDTAYEATNGLTPVNTDTTDNPDYLDLDSDNDSVPDNTEAYDANQDGVADILPNNDTDNDGLADSYDGSVGDYADPNGLIITTTPADNLPNTDGTEDVNYRDIDDDGDGVHTIYEVPVGDTDNNGIPNYLDNDDDGDNVLTADENPDTSDPLNGNPSNAQDTDGDGISDFLDNDDDNDGVLTADEDPNGDGNPMNDNSDGDGRANYLDIDDDNDGILTITEGNNNDDSDGDGHPDYLDQDSDGDGLPDNVEAQTTDGYINPDVNDSDNDGLDDAYDAEIGYADSVGLTPVNTDGTDNPDYLDSDSDNDNVPDFVEAFDFSIAANLINAPDGNPDIEFSGDDIDGDGLDDAFDGDTTGFGDPNGGVVNTNPATDLPNRDLFIYTFYGNSSSPLSPITPDNEVDYRDTDDDGDGHLTNSEDEDRDLDGNPRNDNCNGPPDNLTPNYLDPISCDRIPTGFSPNGDNNNEEFIIPAVDKYPNFSIEVYDRWGNKVYDYDNNGRAEPEWWDGYSTGSMTIAKGQKVPVGTYYYIIRFNGTDNKAPVSGWVYVNY